MPRNASEIPEGILDPLELHGTVVEILDVAAGRLIARKEIGGFTISALPGREIAILGETPEGAPYVEILALSLNGRR